MSGLVPPRFYVQCTFGGATPHSKHDGVSAMVCDRLLGGMVVATYRSEELPTRVRPPDRIRVAIEHAERDAARLNEVAS